VVNKKVDKGVYDAQQDLVCVPMDEGQISNPQPFSLVVAHVAPKQCNLRIYQGKTGALGGVSREMISHRRLPCAVYSHAGSR
jgi:hypothetical protein